MVIIMNNMKIRTVNVNSRGQLVIPDDIRKDFGIKGGSTLVMIERGGELVIKKEAEVLHAMEGETAFWRVLSRESLKRMWGEQDRIWDKIAKNDLRAAK